jgi:hypothetical protein
MIMKVNLDKGKKGAISIWNNTLIGCIFIFCLVIMQSCTTVTVLSNSPIRPEGPVREVDKTVINVRDHGAKGDGKTDDSDAITSAMQLAARSGRKLYIPKTNSVYFIQKGIRVPLQKGQKLTIQSNGATLQAARTLRNSTRPIWKLTPSYQEFAILSVGPAATQQTFPHNFNNNQNIQIEVDGLHFNGGYVPAQYQRNPPSVLVSAIDVSAAQVIIQNCRFENIWGYGVRSFGVQSYTNQHNTYREVGGRGIKPAIDAFGDAIFIAAVAPKAQIDIAHNELMGLKGPKQNKSRSGITFEFSVHPYQATIRSTQIEGYAKSIHVEEKAASRIKVIESQLLDANYTIAMVANKQAVMEVQNTLIRNRGTDGIDAGDGGPVINTDGGGTIRFKSSTLQLDGKRNAYITMVGVDRIENSRIYAYNKNPYFADANIVFSQCTFYDFGGTQKSFFSYMGDNQFRIERSTFHGGGDVHARGQKVKVMFNASTAASRSIQLIQQ